MFTEENDSVDTLQALETYLQSSSHVVIKQQQEISELQTLCRTLKRVSSAFRLEMIITCRQFDDCKNSYPFDSSHIQ